MDKIVYASTRINVDISNTFSLFTSSEHLEKWLTHHAEIEPRVGGKYELFWDPKDIENDSILGCKVLAMAKNRFLCFEWKGPRQFKHFMNNIRPLTNVTVFFIPSDKRTEIHLVPTGWRETDEWQKSREYFANAWTMAFKELEGYACGMKS